MNTKRITIIALLATIGGLILWDIYLAVNDVPNDTISAIFTEASREWWWFSFAPGVLMAHFFFPREKPIIKGSGLVYAIAIFLLAGGLNYIHKTFWETNPTDGIIMFFVGCLLGHLFWSNGTDAP